MSLIAAALAAWGQMAAAGAVGPDAFVAGPAPQSPKQPENIMQQHHIYVGMWVTADGHVRQELLPNNRYDEARGSRASAYQGRYEVDGNTIFYWDDTGFTADGIFVTDDELHHGGMIFFRQS